MDNPKEYAYGNFKTGVIISSITGTALIIISFILSKIDFFLLLNTDLGRFGDYFFSYCTHLGDGTVWIPVAVLTILYRRDKFLLVFCTVAIGTLIVQALKNFFLPAQLRPGTAITDGTLFHHVEWVPLLTNFSFPSGHTTTAFSIFLLGCLFIHKKWIIPVGFLFGLLVGYSRVYLAEHFPLDLGGGMLTAVVSVWLSLLIQKKRDHAKKVVIEQVTTEQTNNEQGTDEQGTK
jgi:membrane-associated phospholipid phosphatase